MKGKTIRLFAALLALLMLTVIAGCSDTNDSSEGTTTTKAGTTTTTKKAETTTSIETQELMKVRVFIGNGMCPDSESEITKNLEEMYNFDIEFIGTELGQEETKINLFVASNDVPEITTVWWVEILKKNGLASFTIEEMQQYMPYSYKFINDLAVSLNYDPDTIWARYYVDGKLNQVPQTWAAGGNPRPLIWRKDMLDEFGLGIPTTIAEMETAFAAYKAKYPDQYPTAGGGKDLLWQSFTEVFNSCGVDFFSWDLKDGKIVPGWTQPEAKEVLGILADWVQKGYISKAFVTMTDADKSNEWTSGKSLYRNWQGIQIIDPPYADGSQFSLIKEVAPNASFAFGPPPTLNEGVLPVNHGWDPFHGGSAGFGKHMQDDPEKLHRLMVFMDDTFNDPDVADYASWGDEGVHWKWSNEEKTLRERLPGFSTSDELKAANLLTWANLQPDYSPLYFKYAVKPEQAMLEQELMGDGGMLSVEKVRRNPNRVKGVLTSPDGEDLSQLYWSDLEKKRDIMVVEIISGEKPLSAYDEWIEYWNENGGAELEEAANRLYLDLWK